MPSQLTNSIPGFSGLNSSTSDLIKQLMSGVLTPGARSAIFDAGAERGVAGGMPGSTGMAGSLFANADLRNIGRASTDQQQQGFQDFLALLNGYSGTVAPNAGQELQNQQFNQNLGFQQQQADFNNNLARDQFGLQRKEYMQKYGPKRSGVFQTGKGYGGMGVANLPVYNPSKQAIY